jgi:hypothetical protein
MVATSRLCVHGGLLFGFLQEKRETRQETRREQRLVGGFVKKSLERDAAASAVQPKLAGAV